MSQIPYVRWERMMGFPFQKAGCFVESYIVKPSIPTTPYSGMFYNLHNLTSESRTVAHMVCKYLFQAMFKGLELYLEKKLLSQLRGSSNF